MLGIAKLLPQIVPVKRETLQVVSLAMAGLVPGSGPIFHIVENRWRLRFREFLFWDGISRQWLGLPQAWLRLSSALQSSLQDEIPNSGSGTQRWKHWAIFVGPSGTQDSHQTQACAGGAGAAGLREFAASAG